METVLQLCDCGHLISPFHPSLAAGLKGDEEERYESDRRCSIFWRGEWLVQWCVAVVWRDETVSCYTCCPCSRTLFTTLVVVLTARDPQIGYRYATVLMPPLPGGWKDDEEKTQPRACRLEGFPGKPPSLRNVRWSK